jgi:hypothetical protein
LESSLARSTCWRSDVASPARTRNAAHREPTDLGSPVIAGPLNDRDGDRAVGTSAEISSDRPLSRRFVLIANVWICLVIAAFVAYRVIGSSTFKALLAELRR